MPLKRQLKKGTDFSFGFSEALSPSTDLLSGAIEARDELMLADEDVKYRNSFGADALIPRTLNEVFCESCWRRFGQPCGCRCLSEAASAQEPHLPFSNAAMWKMCDLNPSFGLCSDGVTASWIRAPVSVVRWAATSEESLISLLLPLDWAFEQAQAHDWSTKLRGIRVARGRVKR